MASWYPNAFKRPGNDAGDFVAGYAKKGLLHTTEGSSAAGAIGAYTVNNSWPHFTVDQLGNVYQHISIDRAARSLENAPGGVETNRGGPVQIEVVGFASHPVWPELQVKALILLMRWIETNAGVKPVGVTFGGAEQAGLHNPLEFSNAQWIAYNGWCGHQHVPENGHWDPGAININNFLPPQGVKPMYDPPILLGEVVASLPRPGGVVLLNRQGDIYAFNCRDAGAPGRHPEYWNRATDRAASLAPLGDTGYYVAKEGASAVVGGAGWYAYF